MSAGQSVWEISRKEANTAKPPAAVRIKLNQPPHYGRMSMQSPSRADLPSHELAAQKASSILKCSQLSALQRGRRVVE
ncbi:hypothetical protein [Comamonas testosteroni]|uniref:hypothetical protein n=1 Tax=Comamonas testosteroni TaxID=285 RepID=UPI0005B4158E|nr:hypothetical protein [Comamonas testosteroni]